MFNNIRVSTVMSPSGEAEEMCFPSTAAYFATCFVV